ncbi:hypothetical protein ACFFX0_24775 [Citricoccus parietis]|uniref:Uncharacterized protein n=1 Tax=Citricoccus parietis TaxID=592307 RepID=A0ABV5G731_9MICC
MCPLARDLRGDDLHPHLPGRLLHPLRGRGGALPDRLRRGGDRPPGRR